MEGDSLYYGLNAVSNNMIMADRKQLKNPNGLILGTPGSGKSFSAKREMTNVFFTTTDDIIIADPEGEYYPLVEALGGQVIHISSTSRDYINPMDINLNYADDDNPLGMKSDFILSLCELIMGARDGMEPEEKSVIDRCLPLVYQKYLNDPKPENMPILGDLYDCLREQKERQAQRIATALEIYVNGSLRVFNHQTNVELDNRLICFDIKELGKQLKKLGMLIVQDQVWNRVTINRNVKRKEGQFIGSFAGYGYRKDPKDKNHLIIDEYAAGIVQEIFKQKLNGMSSQRIASHLNELGVLPPNEYKRANGFNYTCGFQAGLNQKWTVVSVNRILKNESYTGTLIQGKRRKINYKVKKSHDVGSENWIRVEDAHDAIISKGEFQQVQQLLELDTRTAPSQTTVYPLSGFLRCADCGQNMIRRTVTKNGKKYQYYHCSTYKNGGGCTPHMINSEKLTESVLAAIRHQVTLLVEAEKVLSNAELASGEQIGIKILDSQITALEAELERYSNLKIRLYQDLCDDVVSREEYGEMNTRFAQKIKEAQDKIHEIREKKQEALKHDTLLPTWLEEFKQYEHIKTLERRVVVELIDHIDVHSKTEIEIHFCFEDELHSITEKFMEYQAHHGNEVAEE